MMVKLGGLWIVCAAVTLAAQNGQPSERPQQPTFTTGTQYVRVDLYATRDGRLVDDLRPDEITLLEDGVRQTIDRFERIVFRPHDPLTPAREPASPAAERQLVADSRSRVLVVFLDPWHSAYISAGNPEQAAGVQRRFPVLRRLQEAIGPDDLVAVMTPQMRLDDLRFERGLALLAQLEGEWTGPYSVIHPDPGLAFAYDKTELLYQACYGGPVLGGVAGKMIARRRERITLDALDELTSYLGGLREERKALLVVTDGWLLYTPDPGLSALRRGEAPTLPGPPIGGRGTTGGTTVVTERGAFTTTSADETTCAADRGALARLDHHNRLIDLARRANENNVAFYPLSPAGLTTTVARPGAVTPETTFVNTSSLSRQSDLKTLAAETDGYAVVNTNNLADGIERMMAYSSAYYLIGYVSTNSALDGRYRKITVKIGRQGVESRARPGYIAPLPARRTPPRPVDPVTVALGRMANTNFRAPLRLRGAAWAGAAPDAPGGFWIVGDLDPQTRREPAWAKGATAEVAVQTAGGDIVLTRRGEVPAGGPAVAMRVPETGALAAGEYTIRIQLQAADRVTRVTETIPVTIPTGPVALGEAVLWRRGPSTGPQPVRTADPRFQRNERLLLDLPALEKGPVTARLLDRNGALVAVPATVTERADPVEAFHWAVVEVILAPLAPGDYVVEVTHADAVRVTAFRIVP